MQVSGYVTASFRQQLTTRIDWNSTINQWNPWSGVFLQLSCFFIYSELLLGVTPTCWAEVAGPEIRFFLTCRCDLTLSSTTNSRGRPSPNTTGLVRTLLTLFFGQGVSQPALGYTGQTLSETDRRLWEEGENVWGRSQQGGPRNLAERRVLEHASITKQWPRIKRGGQ